jgi:carboxylesterase
MKSTSVLVRGFFGTLLALLVVIGLVMLLFWFWPLGLDNLAAASNAQVTYAEAVAAVSAAAQDEGDAVHPLCHTSVVTSGAKTENVAVIFHGLGTCPQQFAAVSDALHTDGWTVLLVRLPYHGMADRLSEAPAAMKAEAVLREAGHWIDMAQALGDRVTVVGFSGGGTVAAYLANVRSDIDRVVLAAPMLGVQAFPVDLTRPISTLAHFVPNWWGWFNPELKENVEGPAYTYPRYSSRTLAEFLRIGLQSAAHAQATAPAVADIRVLLNANDESVRNEAAKSVAAAWAQNGAEVKLHEFPTSAGLKHDMIDPGQPYQKVDLVYPVLLDAITQTAFPSTAVPETQ